jgi:hypothetical protein
VAALRRLVVVVGHFSHSKMHIIFLVKSEDWRSDTELRTKAATSCLIYKLKLFQEGSLKCSSTRDIMFISFKRFVWRVLQPRTNVFMENVHFSGLDMHTTEGVNALILRNSPFAYDLRVFRAWHGAPRAYHRMLLLAPSVSWTPSLHMRQLSGHIVEPPVGSDGSICPRKSDPLYNVGPSFVP